MKWFKHDSNAHSDAKLKRLKHKYGIVGYGIYWYCVELIAGSIEKDNISFVLEEDAELIALEWSLDQIKVQEIMQYMVELQLFENDSGRITCLKLAKRLDDTNAKNPEIKAVINSLNQEKPLKNSEENRSYSELLGDTPKVSDQIRLDQIRIDKDLNTLVDNPTEKIQSTEKTSDKNLKNTERIELFEKIWEFYGRKGNRKTSLSRFLKLKAKDLDKLKIHVKNYVKSTPEIQYRKGFESYISKQCWNDKIVENTVENSEFSQSSGRFETPADRAIKAAQRLCG